MRVPLRICWIYGISFAVTKTEEPGREPGSSYYSQVIIIQDNIDSFY